MNIAKSPKFIEFDKSSTLEFILSATSLYNTNS